VKIQFLFISLYFFSITTQAQQLNNFCGTEIPSQHWENIFAEYVKEFRDTHQFQNGDQLVEYTIPVIFHVIHSGQSVGTFPNIIQGQINSQITVLNQDFAGTGFNYNTYPSNAFIQWALNQNLPQANLDSMGRVKIANISIKFCLAEKDTLGNILPEPGIERINLNSRGWMNPNTFTTPQTLRAYFDGTIKPGSIWNVRKYLNIWLSDKNVAVPFTGFATLPPLSTLPGITGGGEGTETTDGIWCYSSAAGSAFIFPGGIYASPNVRGRTITHEAGHYLGLRHIWADGNCLTDYCTDTPPAFTSNTGFPVYPLNPGSCSNPSNSPNGEMYMNYMDYSADPAKYMFTYDQAIRMQTAMLNSPFRNQLGTHGLCAAVLGINNEGNYIPDGYELMQNYPNPFNPVTEIGFSIPQQTNVSITIYNSLGEESAAILNEIKTAGNHKVKWDAVDFPSGIYYYQLITEKITITRKMVLIK
jgi:hypothetical protein